MYMYIWHIKYDIKNFHFLEQINHRIPTGLKRRNASIIYRLLDICIQQLILCTDGGGKIVGVRKKGFTASKPETGLLMRAKDYTQGEICYRDLWLPHRLVFCKPIRKISFLFLPHLATYRPFTHFFFLPIPNPKKASSSSKSTTEWQI